MRKTRRVFKNAFPLRLCYVCAVNTIIAHPPHTLSVASTSAPWSSSSFTTSGGGGGIAVTRARTRYIDWFAQVLPVLLLLPACGSEELMHHGVRCEQDDGTTALMRASESGHTEVVRLLLDKGADVNATDTVCGGCAMMVLTAHTYTNAYTVLGSAAACAAAAVCMWI